jgi:GPH family glycoside/pentoside/hexuronide:cation symporter
LIQSNKLPFWKKIVWGSGEFGPASIGMMRSLFYVIFLTDTIGLDPQLASLGAVIGLLWDAINDPLVGMLSDRVQSRWGRRRPFLLLFSIPFGISFSLMWAVPELDSQIALAAYVTFAFMLVDTFGTLLSVPYLSLIPELTKDYDERTSLAGFRTVFQLLGSLTVVIAAPMIIDRAIESGLSQKEGFVTAGGIFGFISIILFLIVFFFIKEDQSVELPEKISFKQTIAHAWANIPFRYVATIFLLNWTMIDMIAVVFPFYLLYWVADGDLLLKANVFGVDLALESAFFGALMLVCILAIPFWLRISSRRNKRDAYVLGMVIISVFLLAIFFVKPGQINLLLILGALAGFGVSSAYVLPDAMFPDIIEWDELRTGKRQEGIYYGARSFIRKLTTTLVIFLVLQLLSRSGYQNPPEGVTNFQQPESALLMIRILISIVSTVMLLSAALLAWFNPMTREKTEKIRELLERKKRK